MIVRLHQPVKSVQTHVAMTGNSALNVATEKLQTLKHGRFLHIPLTNFSVVSYSRISLELCCTASMICGGAALFRLYP